MESMAACSQIGTVIPQVSGPPQELAEITTPGLVAPGGIRSDR